SSVRRTVPKRAPVATVAARTRSSHAAQLGPRTSTSASRGWAASHVAAAATRAGASGPTTRRVVRISGPASLQPKLARDDGQLDLRRPLGDGHEARVAPKALDRELGDVAVAAEDLHRLPGDPLGDLGGEQLGHRRLAHAISPIEEPGRAPHRGARRLDLRRHARELEFDGLELRDRLAELLALPGVLERRLERRLGDADRARGVRDPPALERARHLLEAALDAAEQRR